VSRRHLPAPQTTALYDCPPTVLIKRAVAHCPTCSSAAAADTSPSPASQLPHLASTSCVHSRHMNPPARLYVSQLLLSNQCPPTCSIGSLAGSVLQMAITSIPNDLNVTFCGSLVRLRITKVRKMPNMLPCSMPLNTINQDDFYLFRRNDKAVREMVIDVYR